MTGRSSLLYDGPMNPLLYLFAPFRRARAIAQAHAVATTRDMAEVRFYRALYGIAEIAHRAAGDALGSLTHAKSLLATRFELTNWLLRDHRESDVEAIRGEVLAARSQLLASLAVIDTVLREADSYCRAREIVVTKE